MAFWFWVAMQTAAAPAVAPVKPIDCPVWERELSFADSVRTHDAQAFAAHLDADAVFGLDSKHATRGRTAILKQWSKIVDGSAMRLRWYPDKVITAASGDLAWSTGPALAETPDGNGGWKPMLSRFTSVWRKQADGQWRVVFDTGSEPAPASAEQVQAFHAGRIAHCQSD